MQRLDFETILSVLIFIWVIISFVGGILKTITKRPQSSTTKTLPQKEVLTTILKELTESKDITQKQPPILSETVKNADFSYDKQYNISEIDNYKKWQQNLKKKTTFNEKIPTLSEETDYNTQENYIFRLRSMNIRDAFIFSEIINKKY